MMMMLFVDVAVDILIILIDLSTVADCCDVAVNEMMLLVDLVIASNKSNCEV